MPENKPLASFENPRYLGSHPRQFGAMGHRGMQGVSANLSTAMAGANNDIVIYARQPVGSSLSVQWDILGKTPFSNAGYVYVNGLPAFLEMTATVKMLFVAKDPGAAGNSITVALVDPAGNDQSLSVTVSGKAITVSLATGGGGAITSTSQQVVDAINASITASALVRAYITEASNTVSAVAATALASGSDVTGLTYVFLKTNGSGAISETALNLVNHLAQSTLIYATLQTGNSGAGTVTTLAKTSLSGGVDKSGILAQVVEEETALNTLTGPTGESHNRVFQTNFAPGNTFNQSPLLDDTFRGKIITDEKTIVERTFKTQEVQHTKPKPFGSKLF